MMSFYSLLQSTLYINVFNFVETYLVMVVLQANVKINECVDYYYQLCHCFLFTRNMPDVEDLMQEWPPEFEDLLNTVGLPTAELDVDLAQYVDLICGKHLQRMSCRILVFEFWLPFL